MSAPHDHIRNTFGQYIGHITQHSGACPDCDADLRITEEHSGVFRATVMHDTTCPTWQRIQDGRS